MDASLPWFDFAEPAIVPTGGIEVIVVIVVSKEESIIASVSDILQELDNSIFSHRHDQPCVPRWNWWIQTGSC